MPGGGYYTIKEQYLKSLNLQRGFIAAATIVVFPSKNDSL